MLERRRCEGRKRSCLNLWKQEALYSDCGNCRCCFHFQVRRTAANPYQSTEKEMLPPDHGPQERRRTSSRTIDLVLRHSRGVRCATVKGLIMRHQPRSTLQLSPSASYHRDGLHPPGLSHQRQYRGIELEGVSSREGILLLITPMTAALRHGSSMEHKAHTNAHQCTRRIAERMWVRISNHLFFVRAEGWRS